MKQHLVLIAIAAAFSGAASAQSSVTLFGVVDLGIRQVKNGSAGTLTSLTPDGIASSRLGFRGVEDLGGGLRAAFWLEGFLQPDSGGGNQNWQRRSTVSLIGPFGELRLGRDYVPDFWNQSIFDPFGTNGVGSSINVIGSLNGTTTFTRSDNSVGYFLPALGGLYGQAMVSAGEGAIGNKHTALRIGYATGPLNVAVAYGKTNVDDFRDWIRWNIGASYNLGFMTLMGLFVDTQAEGGAGDGQARSSLLIGGVVPVGEVSSFKFSAIQTTGRDRLDTRDSLQLALGFQHDLSQRTALYANVAQINNTNTATAIPVGPAGIKTGENSSGVEFGIRHIF